MAYDSMGFPTFYNGHVKKAITYSSLGLYGLTCLLSRQNVYLYSHIGHRERFSVKCLQGDYFLVCLLRWLALGEFLHHLTFYVYMTPLIMIGLVSLNDSWARLSRPAIFSPCWLRSARVTFRGQVFRSGWPGLHWPGSLLGCQGRALHKLIAVCQAMEFSSIRLGNVRKLKHATQKNEIHVHYLLVRTNFKR